MIDRSTLAAALLFFFGLAGFSCSSGGGPQVGSQTNWLNSCDSSTECGDYACVCGACTLPCADSSQCDALPGASCVLADDAGAVAFCGGTVPASPICLQKCEGDTCANGSSCIAGICSPEIQGSASVTIDPATRFQTLIGFGASVAYEEDLIVAHPDKAALYDALFSDSGFEVLRMRNRYENNNEAELVAIAEITQAATLRLGHSPTTFISSGSPPAALKANADRFCANGDVNCTLIRDGGGAFDYVGFANYWRESLDAYANQNIFPDYLSIQNNADWIPPDDGAQEACRFLPEEGTTSVTVDGVTSDVEFPGYAEALVAVSDALTVLAQVPELAAPEAGSVYAMTQYQDSLRTSGVGALALHFYGTDPYAVDVDALETLGTYVSEMTMPLFQSEMQADGPGTAILVHYALTAAGAASYLHRSFVSPAPASADSGLVVLSEDSFTTQPSYHALAHYARSTEPGWLRAQAGTDSDTLLVSAWIPSDESALTIVLVNPTDVDIDLALTVPEGFAEFLPTSEVTRTVFEGVERSAPLGPLPASGLVRLPAGAIVTVALDSN